MNKSQAITKLPVNRFDGFTAAGLNEREQSSVVELALAALSEKHRPGQFLGNPEDTRRYLRVKLAEHKNEVFGAIFLNSQHQVIEDRELFFGTIDGASIYPRVVVQAAMECNSSSLVVYHNHPSGSEIASHADKAITARLKEALALVDVRLLDHLVVTVDKTTSFAESGYL